MTQEFITGPTPAEQAQNIADTHSDIARQLAMSQPFDWSAAEIVLRNPAVFTDRLQPQQFEQLSDRVREGFIHLADVVKGQLGVDVSDDGRPHGRTQFSPAETHAEYWYRVNVHAVMHGLQSMVLAGPRPEQGGYEVAKEPVVREAVFLAGELFSLGL